MNLGAAHKFNDCLVCLHRICPLHVLIEPPVNFLRIPCPVDVGVTATSVPILKIAALCLISWPAAKPTQLPTPQSDTFKTATAQELPCNISCNMIYDMITHDIAS